MTRIKRRWNAFVRVWNAFVRVWDAFEHSLRPWEQEGSLRWVESGGGEWELRGTLVPEDVAAEQTPLWSRSTGVRW